MLQEAVDALIDNGRGRPVTGLTVPKSLSDMLKGKQGPSARTSWVRRLTIQAAP